MLNMNMTIFLEKQIKIKYNISLVWWLKYENHNSRIFCRLDFNLVGSKNIQNYSKGKKSVALHKYDRVGFIEPTMTKISGFHWTHHDRNFGGLASVSIISMVTEFPEFLSLFEKYP